MGLEVGFYHYFLLKTAKRDKMTPKVFIFYLRMGAKYLSASLGST
jgi:hypothetical protein